MAELLTLAAPITPPTPPTRTTYTVLMLLLDWGAKRIQVMVRGSDGVDVSAQWNGDEAVTLMSVLNTANLSTMSLHKRVLQKLVTDGKLPAGTVSGTPA